MNHNDLIYQIKDNTVFVDYVLDCRQDYKWFLQWDVKIEIIPKGDKIKLRDIPLFRKLAHELNFLNVRQNPDKLYDFGNKKITVNNPNSKMDRTFEFDDENFNLTPVVYLNEHIEKYNNDDTPDFYELNEYCQSLFQEEILPELRPDLFLKEDER